MTGDDTLLLVVAGGVASELEDLGSEVLKDRREVDCVIGEPCMLRTRRDKDAPGAPAPTRWA